MMHSIFLMLVFSDVLVFMCFRNHQMCHSSVSNYCHFDTVDSLEKEEAAAWANTAISIHLLSLS